MENETLLMQIVTGWDYIPDEDHDEYLVVTNQLLDELCVPVTDNILLGKKIGSGSYSSVYEYRDDQAVKVLLYNPNSSSWGENVIQELYMLKQLRGHQNILNIIQCHNVSLNVYIITERFERTLLDAIWNNEGRRLSPEMRERIKISLELAVEYMHSKRILHLDIKPENIFVRKDESVALGDFGFAKVMNNDGEARFHLGTPQYMRVSKLTTYQKNSKVDDIWALACTIYALENEIPFVTARLIEADPELNRIQKSKAIVTEINEKLPTVTDPYLRDMLNSSY